MAITFKQDDQGIINRVDKHYVSTTKRVSEQWYLDHITQLEAEIEQLNQLKTDAEGELALLRDSI